MAVLCGMRGNMLFSTKPAGTYETLLPDESKDDPLAYIGKDYEVLDGFHTNLPIVILDLDTEIPIYKEFRDKSEQLFDVEPYTTGRIEIIDNGTGNNTLLDEVVYDSALKIKGRGHSSFSYDKMQYKFKSLLPDGNENNESILGMGRGSEWILNGSMADKSMIRNYLPYRIASEIDGNNMAPDSRYCEVLMEEDGKLYYQGVFLLMETISRGEERVNIDKYRSKNIYSSYIVRRDRLTSFDIELDTFGREVGLVKGRESQETDNWIGLKYPSASNVTDQTVDYITKDFSKVEQIIYSEDEDVFRLYDKYINVDSFVDYFLINEYFGNYDAGEHSTYMHKNSGEPLYMGPVWDYDQALNNSRVEELKASDIAFQMQPFFKELCNDKAFVEKLITRYADLQQTYLSEEHVDDVIDETVAYLRSAQVREWYRWEADYMDNTDENPKNYHLLSVERDGFILDRSTDEYMQEIYVIKKYIHEHSISIKGAIKQWEGTAQMDTSSEGLGGLFFILLLLVILLPSYIIQRKG